MSATTPCPTPAYGYVVGAGIAKGRIASMDLDAARAAPGVLAIVTARNAGKLGKGKFNTAKLLGGPEIEHYHQARRAGGRRDLRAGARRRAAGAHRLRAHARRVRPGRRKGQRRRWPKPPTSAARPTSTVGDFDGAFAAAPVQLDATYTTPDQSHAMMEPHASTAAWQGDKLTLWTAEPDDRLERRRPGRRRWASPRRTCAWSRPSSAAASAASCSCGPTRCWPRWARARPGRPVKVALQRPLMVNNTTHRPATIQRMRLGAGARRQAHRHRRTRAGPATCPAAGPRPRCNQTRLLYAGANRLTATRLAVLDLPEGNAMRAPGEAPGLMALEIAMDEMAEKLRPGPGRVPHPQRHPGRPRASRAGRSRSAASIECLRMGAERFGWNRRKRAARQVRDGRWLVGMGVAAAFRNNLVMKSAARVRLDARGMRHGGNRHDRHRHRQLHRHRADRRRNDGRAARQSGWCAWAIRPSRSRRAPAASGAPTVPPPACTPPA